MTNLKDGGLYYKKHEAYFVGGECPGCLKVFNIATAKANHYRYFSRREGIRFSVLMCPDCAAKEFDQVEIDRVGAWCVANADTLREMNGDRDTISSTS
jgi:hypothetical protein